MGQVERALPECERALQIRPNVATLLLGRGLARLSSGQAEDAQADFSAALVLMPRYADALQGRCLVARRLRRQAQANADCKEARALDADVAARVLRAAPNLR